MSTQLQGKPCIKAGSLKAVRSAHGRLGVLETAESASRSCNSSAFILGDLRAARCDVRARVRIG